MSQLLRGGTNVLDHVIGHHYVERLGRKRELHSSNLLEPISLGHDPLIHYIDRVDNVVVRPMVTKKSGDAACARADFKKTQLRTGRQARTI
jgi:hypothetical protein